MNLDPSPTHIVPFFNNPTLGTARTNAIERGRQLDEILSGEVSQPYTYASDTASLVVFGSLARGEWTTGSDLDWTYLVDGQATQTI
ncbi:MAG TPA: nucleotidyltransferase domain-containing protein [Candidatus Angelobacter sp.]|jgi:UTP:GlnB (protein PII) uridylyltransferase|nr:nucleotidyltransferase domain-containing protein [Candidatus Angelobacter sp.]